MSSVISSSVACLVKYRRWLGTWKKSKEATNQFSLKIDENRPSSFCPALFRCLNCTKLCKMGTRGDKRNFNVVCWSDNSGFSLFIYICHVCIQRRRLCKDLSATGYTGLLLPSARCFHMWLADSYLLAAWVRAAEGGRKETERWACAQKGPQSSFCAGHYFHWRVQLSGTCQVLDQNSTKSRFYIPWPMTVPISLLRKETCIMVYQWSNINCTTSSDCLFSTHSSSGASPGDLPEARRNTLRFLCKDIRPQIMTELKPWGS